MNRNLLLFIPIILLLSAFHADDLGEGRKSAINYRITYTLPNKSIKSDEIQLDFKIVNSLQQPVQDSVLASYNHKAVTLHPDKDGKVSLKLKKGKYIFQFYLDQNHAEIYTDSIAFLGGCSTGFELYFAQATYEIMSDKPVIYVYPETTQAVRVELNVKGRLGYTYPAYNDGWNFVANHDGTIKMNNKEYDYLFWDAHTSINSNEVDLNTGFIVTKDSLTSFFERQLSVMGLTPREQQDFITYWCPRMIANETNYVHFMFNEECNKISEMNITPAPKNICRVYMLWSDAEGMSRDKMHKQEIPTFNREGFTVLEWGGSELTQLSESLQTNK